MFEINGNLADKENGFANYDIFENTIVQVWAFFSQYFGVEIMNRIDLYIDNATCDSGYTPIITPVFKKFLIIKLAISDINDSGIIAFQFAHELMHYVFYSIFGIEKSKADNYEEAICTASSLIVLHKLFPNSFYMQNEYVKNLANKGYRDGARVAESLNYDFSKLVELVKERGK